MEASKNYSEQKRTRLGAGIAAPIVFVFLVGMALAQDKLYQFQASSETHQGSKVGDRIQGKLRSSPMCRESASG